MHEAKIVLQNCLTNQRLTDIHKHGPTYTGVMEISSATAELHNNELH